MTQPPRPRPRATSFASAHPLSRRLAPALSRRLATGYSSNVSFLSTNPYSSKYAPVLYPTQAHGFSQDRSRAPDPRRPAHAAAGGGLRTPARAPAARDG